MMATKAHSETPRHVFFLSYRPSPVAIAHEDNIAGHTGPHAIAGSRRGVLGTCEQPVICAHAVMPVSAYTPRQLGEGGVQMTVAVYGGRDDVGKFKVYQACLKSSAMVC